ncbi:unnamed protein product [Rotaria sp. Silwood2]|nr:unnamed protein product [Rotaria sp. Silwood2]CAF4442530.1 unnamed protein product [Rotaria sp. Silwood2]
MRVIYIIPNEVQLELSKLEADKARYRLSLSIKDVNGIQLKSSKLVMLTHDGLKNEKRLPQYNTFSMNYNDNISDDDCQ